MRWYYSNRVPGFADLQADEQDLRIRKRMQGHHPAVLTALWQSFCRRDQRDVLPKITCPTGIFRAGVMPGCSEETARYYADHIPAPTTVVCFEENSHSLILEDPQRFAAELRTFLEA